MKFGGMATATKNSRDYIVEILKRIKNKKILLIVSAMGRVGFPYATDTLLQLVEEKYITDKEKSRLLACGETIASIVVAEQLNSAGLNSYALSLKEAGITFNGSIEVNTKHILELFEQYDVLIAPGFLYLENDEVRTFNRGGSDFSAILLADALNSRKVFLFKDVNGIFPFVMPGSNEMKCYDKLSYEQALMLCEIGYQIVQKKAILFAKEHKMAIIIANYMSNQIGTIISNEDVNTKVLGMSFTKNSIKIATKTPNIKEECESLLLEHHLFYKSVQVKKNYLEYSFGINQMQNAKKLLINNYFSDFLR